MNMDIGGGYSSLIIEMLMYLRNDFIELLPALLIQWSSGKITNEHHLLNGVYLAIINVKEQIGEVKITSVSEGLRAMTLTINVE